MREKRVSAWRVQSGQAAIGFYDDKLYLVANSYVCFQQERDVTSHISGSVGVRSVTCVATVRRVTPRLDGL